MRGKKSLCPFSTLVVLIVAVFGVALFMPAQDTPLSARVQIQPLHNYSGQQLAKPSEILIYDFAVDDKDITLDKTQQYRLRHLIRGDETKKSVGENAVEELSKELEKRLRKTGIRVARATDTTAVRSDSLTIKGTFTDLSQGTKTERVAVGMGAGSADVMTNVKVAYNASSGPVEFSEFNTSTTLSKNVGAGVPIAAGVNPVAAGAKATVGDRKKNVHAYAEKTADAIAKQISDQMTGQGWVAKSKS